MSTNPNHVVFTELDAARMHGSAVPPEGLVDKLGLVRGDKLIIEAVDRMLAMRDPSPDQLRDAAGAVLHMFSKSRMSEAAAGIAAPGAREGFVADFVQKLAGQYRDAFVRISRNKIDALATILMTTGDIAPLLMQIEMEQSLAPARLRNALREQVAKVPAAPRIQLIGDVEAHFAPPPVSPPPASPKAPAETDFRALVDSIVRYKPADPVGQNVAALRIAGSRRALESRLQTAARKADKGAVARRIHAQNQTLKTLDAPARAAFITNLDRLGVLPFFVEMAQNKDLTWPAPMRAELLRYDTQKAQADIIQDTSSKGVLESMVRALTADHDQRDLAALRMQGDNFAELSTTQFLTGGADISGEAQTHMLTQHAKTHEAVLGALDRSAREKLFAALVRGGAAAKIERAIDTGTSVWPRAMQQEFREWVRVRPDAMPKIVEVDRLLPPGADSPTDITHAARRSAAQPAAPSGQEPRLEWLIAALKEDGFSARDMTLYREKTVERPGVGQAYTVLGVSGRDAQGKAHDFQIAVCPVKGNATYILRRPVDFTKEAVTLAQLKADDTVFQTSCYTQDQWLRNVRSYAYSDLADLQTQLKTRIGWHDKKEALIESFRVFCQETRQIPLTHDNSIIEQGALARRATWARAYAALQAKSIAGLEEVRSFKDLAETVFGTGVMSPRGRARAGQDRTVNARALFNGVVVFLSENPGRIPANTDRIDGRSVTDINRAFRSGAVSDPEQILPPQSRGKLSTIQDFMLALGLAEKGRKQVLKPLNTQALRLIARLTGSK